MRIALIGDTHGKDNEVVAEVLKLEPDLAIHVGDFDAEKPIDEIYAALPTAGVRFYWIHGNHDVDREHWHDNTLGSAWASYCLDGRVLEDVGLNIAGLGGHFIDKVWHPDNGDPKFSHRTHYLAACGKGNLWRGGLPRKVRSAIWWEDYERLWDQRADILVLHEAPKPHPYGHRVLAELGEAMGAKLVVHGHHHERYDAVTNGGVTVIGLAEREVRVIDWDGGHAL